MREIVSVNAYDATFRFEPPVPIRDDEETPVSLARLVTIAGLGVARPTDALHQVWENGLQAVFTELARYNPATIASELNDILEGHHIVTVDQA
jgi:hypothetical protein